MGHFTTVAQYLASLPPDRRAALAEVRAVINARLPAGYQETIQYNMISWIVPPSRLSATYNGQPLALASLGSQKHYMALYLMTVYGKTELGAWFRDAYRATGKKLDMGKACIRFRTLDALPLDVVGEAIARVPVDAYLAAYEESRSPRVAPKPIARKGRAAAAAPTRTTRTAAKRPSRSAAASRGSKRAGRAR
jgi:uncharacterized protein DUF1801